MSVCCVLDRWTKQHLQRQRSESGMKRQPAIDTARNRYRANVEQERHRRQPLLPKGLGVCARARTAGRIQTMDLAVVVNQCPQVAAEAAHMWCAYGHDGIGCDGGIDSVAALFEHVDTSLGGAVVGGCHHRASSNRCCREVRRVVGGGHGGQATRRKETVGSTRLPLPARVGFPRPRE